MRNRADRIRHTLLFEGLLILLSVGLLPLVFHMPVDVFGVLSVILSLLAMSWNYLYNVAFDKMLVRLGRSVAVRPFWLRTVHAVAFEIGFAFVSVPLIMYALDYSLWKAIVLDAVYLVLVPVYAFLFNLAYDRIFPCPE